MLQTFTSSSPFLLESGASLPSVTIGYHTYGALNEEKNNVVWVFHGFSLSTECALWWDKLIGKGKTIDTDRYFVVCANMPGSCYGSINPLFVNPLTGSPYYYDFPWFTPLDMIRAFKLLAKRLGIERVKLGIGVSTGGMQLLEWTLEEPSLFEKIVPIAIGYKSSPWAKAIRATQRMCIEIDPTWGEKNPSAGMNGMKAARALGVISYRHYDAYQKTQNDEDETKLENYRAESYQRHQGEKIAARFNAFSYYFLSKSLDAYHLGRNRGNIEDALRSIRIPTLIVGIEQDLLFPLSEQRFLAEHIPQARLHTISSVYGHDGFLLEYEDMIGAIKKML